MPAPAGITAGDLDIVIGVTDENSTLTIDTGTPEGGLPAWNLWFNGSLAGAGLLRIWYRIKLASSTDVQLRESADFFTACRIAVTVNTFNPYVPLELSASGSEATSDTSFSFATGTSTTGIDRLCFVVCTSGVDSATPQGGTNTANTSLTSVTATPIANYQSASGTGGGFFVATGIRAASGTTGTWTNTMVSATTKAYAAFCIAPFVFTPNPRVRTTRRIRTGA